MSRGGQRPPLDIEWKHVTIQGPSPDMSPVATFCTFYLRVLAAEPSNPSIPARPFGPIQISS
jgi:hypothetical protein